MWQQEGEIYFFFLIVFTMSPAYFYLQTLREIPPLAIAFHGVLEGNPHLQAEQDCIDGLFTFPDDELFTRSINPNLLPIIRFNHWINVPVCILLSHCCFVSVAYITDVYFFFY